MILVYRFRVKSLNGLLNKQSRAVNFVWNFCNDRQYVSEEEARIDAMERAEQTGHSYKVMKFCGTAVCHKKAEWRGAE